MNIRKHVLWRIPAYYLAVSYISFHLLVLLYSSFCIVKTVDAEGVTNVSANPILTRVVSMAVLLAALLLGGLLLCRTMTRCEVALSAGIISILYVAWMVSECLAPGWDASFSTAIYVTSLNAEVSSLLNTFLHHPQLASFIACFTPMLLIPFGKKSLPVETTAQI